MVTAKYYDGGGGVIPKFTKGCEYFTFPRRSVVNTDINFTVFFASVGLSRVFLPSEQLLLGLSTFRGQDAI